MEKIKIVRAFVVAKNYINRVAGYAMFINFYLLLSTFLVVKEIQVNHFVIMPIAVLILLFMGWLDYTFILKEEQKHLNARNDLKDDLEKIKNRLGIK